MLEPPDHFTPTEKAIFYVAQYPCEHCLLPQISTTDQLSTFILKRQISTLVASCWSSRVGGYGDLLYAELKRKSISRDCYEWVQLKTSYLEALWGLCQLLAPRIADELKSSGYEQVADCSQALFYFRAVVMEQGNHPIQLSFGYAEISGRDVDAALKLKSKLIRSGLTKKESIRFKNLTKKNNCHHILSLELLTQVFARNFYDKAISAQFQIFCLAMANLCDKEATISRKGGSWGWNQGVKLKGSSDSTYSPKASDS
jgi:hypothetical protein